MTITAVSIWEHSEFFCHMSHILINSDQTDSINSWRYESSNMGRQLKKVWCQIYPVPLLHNYYVENMSPNNPKNRYLYRFWWNLMTNLIMTFVSYIEVVCVVVPILSESRLFPNHDEYYGKQDTNLYYSTVHICTWGK